MKEGTRGRLLAIVNGSDHDEKDDPNKDDSNANGSTSKGFACVPSVKLSTNKRKRARMVNRVKIFSTKHFKLLNNNT